MTYTTEFEETAEGSWGWTVYQAGRIIAVDIEPTRAEAVEAAQFWTAAQQHVTTAQQRAELDITYDQLGLFEVDDLKAYFEAMKHPGATAKLVVTWTAAP